MSAPEAMSRARAPMLRVRVPLVAMRAAPREDGERLTQALFGETVEALERRGEWLRARMRRDGYEGFLRAADLEADDGAAATHTPVIPRTLIFPVADIKAAPARPLFMGARARVVGRQGRFARLAGGGFVIAAHLRALSAPAAEAADIAEMFLHAPYLWGGCSIAGIDCSGLTQMALRMAGRAGVPRDSGDQARRAGAPLPAALARGGRLRRGDLVFWKGHVAMMLDGTRIIHANGHHMRVAVESLEEAVRRIRAGGGGEITAIRRP